LALVLILIIAGLSLLGALTTLNVFNSIFFAIPGVMLMLNILICSLNRWKSISVILGGGKITQPESFYATGAELKNIRLRSIEACNLTEKILLAHGYRVRKTTENNIHLAADKNRYFRLGTYLSHFSLILFVAAFIFGFHFGFRDVGFAVTEGETKQVGHETNLALNLVSFTYEEYDNGMPKDYRSQVVLYENNQPVREALIRVNHPLYYKGTRFYQSFFGTSAKLQVTDESGLIVFDGSVPLSSFAEDLRYSDGYIDLPGQGLAIRVIASSIPEDSMIPAGKLAIGIIQDNQQINLKLIEQHTPTIINGLGFTFQGITEYSGFQITRDPTNTLIWIASALFIAGICSVLYFPHHQVWILCQTRGENSRLLIRFLVKPGFDAKEKLNKLVKEIENKLPTHKGKV
jgi:cytochrome c biogenesis protein